MAEITTVSELRAAYPMLVSQIEKQMLGEDIVSSVQIKKDVKGNIVEWSEEIKDDKGVLISRRVDQYSFYESGEVNVIIQQIFDHNGLVSDKQIKHFLDGKKPGAGLNEQAEPKEK